MLATLTIPEDIIEDISAEILRARAKFPGAFNLNTALMEEVGEFASAQMQGRVDDVRKEGIQVISTVLRIMLEGDQSLTMTAESMQK